MNPLQILASFYDQDGGDITRRRLRAMFGDDAAFLLQAGIFGQASGYSEAPCRCPEGDHTATVTWKEAKGAYRARCPKGGGYWLDPEEVETHAFNTDAFCEAVAGALGVKPSKRRKLPEDEVRYSGDALLGQTRFPIFLVRNMLTADVLAAVIDFDRRKVGHSRGVVLCAALPPETMRRNSFHAFVTFCDILDLQEGTLQRRPDALRRVLGDAIQKIPPAQNAERLRGVIEQYQAEYGTKPSVNKLADYVSTLWPEDQTPPGRTVCSEMLKQMGTSAP